MINNKDILVTNIQRFCLHDGPGIRTTVFLKGCPLTCPWCSNPENINPWEESYVKNDTERIYGTYMSYMDIYNEVMKDRDFYAYDGGVTYSGGEFLLQAEKMEPLFSLLKKERISQCVETSLFGSVNAMEVSMAYIDLFYVDIKLLNEQKCASILHGNLNQFLCNVYRLFAANKPVIFRIPVIPGYTTEEENIWKIKDFLNKFKPRKVELLKGHNLGTAKYHSLGKKAPIIADVPQDFLMAFQRIIQSMDIPVEICEI